MDRIDRIDSIVYWRGLRSRTPFSYTTIQYLVSTAALHYTPKMYSTSSTYISIRIKKKKYVKFIYSLG